MAKETLFGGVINFTMLYPGTVLLRVSGQHGYGPGATLPAQWELSIEFDGNVARSSGGAGAVTENPFCEIAIFNVTAGNHSAAFKWFGQAGTMSFTSGFAVIDRRY